MKLNIEINYHLIFQQFQFNKNKHLLFDPV